jgi:hypothetical protein
MTKKAEGKMENEEGPPLGVQRKMQLLLPSAFSYAAGTASYCDVRLACIGR